MRTPLDREKAAAGRSFNAWSIDRRMNSLGDMRRSAAAAITSA